MKFQTVNLKQGSPEWLDFRREKCTASEAPMMLGLHKNVTRNELLRMKKLGTDQEFSDYVQKFILDKGHDVEDKAREILEAENLEDLYPVTGFVGNLSASLDGITLDGRMIFEHKQYNAELAEALDRGDLSDQHMAQVQQQLMLTEAESCIFVCSDGTSDNWHDVIIAPDQAWFKRITQGWCQFLDDLESYEVVDEKPVAVGEVIEGLPTPGLVVSAEVHKSNLPMFVSAAQKFIDGIKTELVSDQDFADAESTVKFCKKAEDELDSAKSNALSQTVSLDEALKTIDNIKGQLRQKRLILEKLVKSEKENRKNSLIIEAQQAWRGFIADVNKSLGINYFNYAPDFAGAIKGRKLLSAMENEIATTLANSKIEANIEAERIKANIAMLDELSADYKFLFNDFSQIVGHPAEALKGIIESRINQRKSEEQAKLEAERERIRAEEKRKIEQEELRKQEKQDKSEQVNIADDVTSAGAPNAGLNIKSKQEENIHPFDSWFKTIEDRIEGADPIEIKGLLIMAYNLGRNSIL